MLQLAIVLSVLEAVVALTVLALYLLLILRTLRRTSEHAARVAFGVRAIESQTRPVGPGLKRLNRELSRLAAALPVVAEKAERVASGSR